MCRHSTEYSILPLAEDAGLGIGEQRRWLAVTVGLLFLTARGDVYGI